jgi:hypothetical protein
LRLPVEKPILMAGESREAAITGKAEAGEVIIGMRAVGSVVRLAAIDVASGTEVVVFGPATTPPRALEELARRQA